MNEKPIRKAYRLSSKDNYKLKELSRKTGLSEAEVIRQALEKIELKEKPPKDFYDLLNKINNIGNNINQIAKVANQRGEIYYDELKIYFKIVENFIKECRKKYL